MISLSHFTQMTYVGDAHPPVFLLRNKAPERLPENDGTIFDYELADVQSFRNRSNHFTRGQVNGSQVHLGNPCHFNSYGLPAVMNQAPRPHQSSSCAVQFCCRIFNNATPVCLFSQQLYFCWLSTCVMVVNSYPYFLGNSGDSVKHDQRLPPPGVW